MGGGGVLRTAAKVAGVGVASAGIRGAPVAQPAEQSIRQASRPVSAVFSSEGVKTADAAPLHTAASWDDWDFAHDDGLVMEAGEPTTRVVFGEVPSFQEAKAAATELKNAIDEVYLSSSSSVCQGSTGSEVSVQSPLLPGTETKSGVINAISTPMPKHALQAFKFLSTNSEAQTIVASVASDPTVWNAIMQNPSIKDYLLSHQTAAAGVVRSEESLGILERLHHSHQKDNQGNGFLDFMELMQNFKVTVTEMVSNVSKYFNNLFGLSEEKTSSGVDGNTRTSFMDHFAMGGTLMGLAVLVIMVVLLKRV